MHAAAYGLLPLHFINMFHVNCSIYTDNTRQKIKFITWAINKMCINLLWLLLVLFYGMYCLLVYVYYPT